MNAMKRLIAVLCILCVLGGCWAIYAQVQPLGQPDKDVPVVKVLVVKEPDKTEAEQNFARTKDFDPNELELMASIYLHQGLVDDADQLLLQHFEGLPGSEAKADQQATTGARLLFARSKLLRHQLGKFQPKRIIQTPSEMVLLQFEVLNQAEKTARDALEELNKEKTNLGAEEYLEYRAQLLLVQATSLLEKGDVRYRLEPKTGNAQADSALAFYNDARKVAYEATLVKQTPEVLDLAQRIVDRMSWLKQGLGFGGVRFYEFTPFMGGLHSQRWQPMGQLEQALDRNNQNSLYQLLEHRDRQIKEALKFVADIKKNLLEKAEREQLRRQQRVQHLMERLKTLEEKVAKLDDDNDKDYVKGLKADMDTLRHLAVQGEGVAETLKLRKTALEGRRDDLLRALEDSLKFASTLASKPAVTQLQKGLNGKSPLNVDDLAKWAKELGNNRQSLNQVFVDWPESATSAQTKLGQLELQIAAAKSNFTAIEKAIEQAGIQLQQQAEKIEREELQSRIGKLKSAIAQDKDKLEEFLKAGKDRAAELQKELAANHRKKIEDELKRATQKIGQVEGQLQHAKEFLERVKDLGGKVESAIHTAEVAIMAAGNIPTGIIAGMANGVFTDKPKSLIEAAKLVPKLAEFAIAKLEKAEQALQRIEEVQKTINSYKAQVEQLNVDLAQHKIEEALQKLHKEVDNQTDKIKKEVRKREVEISRLDVEQLLRDSKIAKLGQELLTSQKAQLEATLKSAEIVIEQHKGEKQHVQAETRFCLARSYDLVTEITKVNETIKNIDANLTEAAKLSEERKQQEKDLAAENVRFNKERKIIELNENLRERLKDEKTSNQLRAILAQMLDIMTDLGELKKGQTSAKQDSGQVLTRQNLDMLSLGTPVQVVNHEYRTLLDATNRNLFLFANWLYFLTKDEDCLRWAITCSTVHEAKIVYEHLLQRHYTRIQEQYGNSRVELFGVQIDPAEVFDKQQRARVGDKLIKELQTSISKREDGLQIDIKGAEQIWFSVSTIRAAAPTVATMKLKTANGKIVREHVPIYQPLQDEKALIFVPAQLQRGDPGVLWDVYAIPEWETPQPLPIPVEIEPVGPTQYVTAAGTVKEVPFFWNHIPNHAAVSATFHGAAVQVAATANKGAQLLEGPLGIDRNYPWYSGRGIDNTWKVVIPEGAPKLKKLTVLFGYIRPLSTSPEAAKRVAPKDFKAAGFPGKRAPLPAEEQYAEDKKIDGFEVSPAGVLSRVDLLERALKLMPSFEDLSPSEPRDFNQPNGPKKKPHPKALDALKDVAKLAEIATVKIPKNEMPNPSVIADKIISEQIAGIKVPRDKVMSQISLGEIWVRAGKALGKFDKEISEMAGTTKEVRDNTAQILKALDPAIRFVNRLNYEIVRFKYQQEIVRQLDEATKAKREVVERLEKLKEKLKQNKDLNAWLDSELPANLPDRLIVQEYVINRLLDHWAKQLAEAMPDNRFELPKAKETKKSN
jgi:hypothetical protein